ncbi:MAG TPA: pilus (MSHA type) biogenesis protein MshL [Steroidobacteraceae bacterium]|nr:pilus (MSHA type) biogenesis protein MshL [Steroidobacteraceae bacterium]
MNFVKSLSLAMLLLLSAGTNAQTPAAQGNDASAAARFDVEVTDAPARAFFEGLTEGTSMNMLIHPDVSGRITMSLKHVTIEEVLNATRDLYGYDYRRIANGYMILPVAIQTRIFHLNYLDMQRYGVSKTRISSGQVTQGNNSQYGANAAASTTPTATTDQNGKPVVDVSGTAVETRNDSDFWKGVTSDLKAIVGDKPGRNVVVNPQSGVIVIRAMPDELRDASDYIHRTADAVTREVVLEAKIIEVELDDAYQAGINWGAIIQRGASHYFIGQSAPPGGFDTNPLTPTGNPITVGPGNPVNGLINSTLGGAITLAADTADFNSFIELLGSQGQTHVLSSPRVATLQNQKAIIKAGSDQFYVTGVENNTTTGTATTSSQQIDLTPFFSGVALDVTPQISDDGHVLLHIHPAVSEVTNQITTLSAGNQTDVLPLALSQIRESDSMVRAKSGQIIVIGGLMRQTRENQAYKTPLLGDIPLLGKLFRSERKQSKTVELVILLRPQVVDDGDWQALVDEPTARIDELKKQGHLQ